MRLLRQKALVLLLSIAILLPAGRAVALEPPSSARMHGAGAQSMAMRLATQIRKTSLDCSHLVHYLYNRVGLRYTYAESRKLYNGVAGFARVLYPQPGDLIVWRGHVGIVVDPAARSFVSALRTGVKVAQYDSRYWKNRGKPRFFRYAGASSPEHSQWASAHTKLDSYVTVSAADSVMSNE